MVFEFTLINNTDKDFRLDAESDSKVAARLYRENALFLENDGTFLRLDYPIYVPEHGRARLLAHVKYPYTSSDPVDPLNGSDDERHDWETKLNRYATLQFNNLSGFAILDTTDRYEIDLPSGWEKRSKETLRIKENCWDRSILGRDEVRIPALTSVHRGLATIGYQRAITLHRS